MQFSWIIQHSKHLALAAAASALLIGAAAATGTQADSTDSSAELQEVVVTANKRVEDTKDVPVSIGVIEGKELTDLHVDSYEDISRLVPGVSFAAHNNGPNGAGPGQHHDPRRQLHRGQSHRRYLHRRSTRSSRSPATRATRSLA